MTLAAWILSLLTLLVPPDRAARLPAYPGWAETVELRTARYVSIAEDIAAVVEDPAERLPFGGAGGRAFGNLVEGVNGYLSEMVHDFPRMLAAMATGDALHVATKGKAEGYFSDELEDYERKLRDNYEATVLP